MIEGVIALAVLVLVVMAGMRLVYAILFSVALHLVLTGAWPLSLPQQMVSGMNGWILLALPLFVFAGGLMNASGLSERIIDLARALVGRFPGGLAQVNVLDSMFFGGVIGTSVADLAGTGTIIIPAMKKDGYPGPFAAALTATSSGIGPLIPPSSPMILYAAVTGTSLGALFLAGVVPGVLLGLSMMVIVAVLARRHGWQPIMRFSGRLVWQTGKAASWAFGVPVIIVAGLVFGVFTPTESGAFAVLYALIVALFIYKTVSLKDLYRVLIDAAALTGEVMLIVGLSVALGWTMSRARIPGALANIIDSVVPGENALLRITAMVVLAILAGMVLDPLIPVIVPIILPTLLAFDVDLIHFGILMVMTVVIGQVTPPVAMSLLVAGKIAKEDLYDVFKANVPFLFVMVVMLVALIAIPELSTWLPSVFRP
ncbi:MAG TPA: TRAP transporter large permease [Acidimicrobiia bacterium]|nr:TRAP transporter large permease [Acidimicrobiia bacterium]